jgi:hypothetical protein
MGRFLHSPQDCGRRSRPLSTANIDE